MKLMLELPLLNTVHTASPDSPGSVLAVNLCRWPGLEVGGLGQAEAGQGQDRHRPPELGGDVSHVRCWLCCGQLVIVTRVSGSRHLNIDRGRHLQARAAQAAAPRSSPGPDSAQTQTTAPGLSSLSSGVSSLLSRPDVSPSASCIHYKRCW